MSAYSKYTDDRVLMLADALAKGLSYKAACVAVGIHYSTYRRWYLERDEFRELMDDARSSGMLQNLASIGEAAEKDWRAAAFLVNLRLRDAEPVPDDEGDAQDLEDEQDAREFEEALSKMTMREKAEYYRKMTRS